MTNEKTEKRIDQWATYLELAQATEGACLTAFKKFTKAAQAAEAKAYLKGICPESKYWLKKSSALKNLAMAARERHLARNLRLHGDVRDASESELSADLYVECAAKWAEIAER